MRIYICLAAVILSASVLAQSEIRSKEQTVSQSPFLAGPSPQVFPPGIIPEPAPEPPMVGAVQSDYRIEDLPWKVQEAARFVAGRERYQKIADVDRESARGLVVWEIEFERAGGNVEIYIDNNGIFLSEPGLVDFRVVQPVPSGVVTNAFGAPPGSQVGHSTSVVAHNWESLPAAIQKRAAKFGGKEMVADIDREFVDRRIEFEIEFQRNGWNLEVQFAEDGTIMESNDPQVAPVDAVPHAGAGTAGSWSSQAGALAQP